MVMGLALMFSMPTSSKNNSQSSFTTHVTVTTYNAVRSQCDKTPTITADGTRIDHKKVKNGQQRIAAISSPVQILCLPAAEIAHDSQKEVRIFLFQNAPHHPQTLPHVDFP